MRCQLWRGIQERKKQQPQHPIRHWHFYLHIFSKISTEYELPSEISPHSRFFRIYGEKAIVNFYKIIKLLDIMETKIADRYREREMRAECNRVNGIACEKMRCFFEVQDGHLNVVFLLLVVGLASSTIAYSLAVVHLWTRQILIFGIFSTLRTKTTTNKKG